MNKLSHSDADGKARMVDVSDKPQQHRMARAGGKIYLQPETVELIRENAMKKGEVLSISEFAGISAAKRCSDLIPLCHPLLLTDVKVKAELQDDCVYVESMVKCTGQTGVEMEALTGVNVALLTVYDMCKAVDKTMRISDITLLEKTKQ